MNPGEYPQPLARTSTVNFPVVNGYTTARLRNRSVGTIAPEMSKLTLVLSNVGPQSCTLQLKQTDNIVSGPRTNVGSPITLGVQGTKQVAVSATAKVLEVTCTSGTSEIRCQVESLLNWEAMPFGRMDSLYPVNALIRDKHLPWSVG